MSDAAMEAPEAPAGERVTIRQFRPGDVEGLLALEARCYPPERRMHYGTLRPLLEDPAAALLVIEGGAADAARVCGGLIVRRDAEQLTVVALSIDPDYRRLGLGRRLMDWARLACLAAGLPALGVPLEAENAAGAAFLASLGFSPAPDGAPYFTGPEDGRLWRKPAASQEPP